MKDVKWCAWPDWQIGRENFKVLFQKTVGQGLKHSNHSHSDTEKIRGMGTQGKWEDRGRR